MSSVWVQQLFQRLLWWLPVPAHRTRLTATGRVRIAVGPPALEPWADDSGLSDIQDSRWQDSQPSPSASASDIGGWSNKRLTPLPDIRAEFLSTLRDLPAAACDALESRIRVSRSLRELWHLRPEVFKLVALHRDQLAAQMRLDRLNRHFPSDALRGQSRSSLQSLRRVP